MHFTSCQDWKLTTVTVTATWSSYLLSADKVYNPYMLELLWLLYFLSSVGDDSHSLQSNLLLSPCQLLESTTLAVQAIRALYFVSTIRVKNHNCQSCLNFLLPVTLGDDNYKLPFFYLCKIFADVIA